LFYSRQKQKLVRALPIENIVLESDSPALSLPNKELNFPWSILHTAREIAKIKKIDVYAVFDIASRNSGKLFSFKKLKKLLVVWELIERKRGYDLLRKPWKGHH